MALFDFRKKTEAKEKQARKATKSAAKKAPKEVVEKSSSRQASSVPAGHHFALISPHVTERARLLSEQGQYVFRIKPEVTKRQVRESVERFYNVHVDHVQIIAMREKARRRGLTEGVKRGYKKAVVALRKGEAIDIF